MNSMTLFSKTPPLKLFLLVSVPGAISMLASALYQTIDGVFVGRFLGETAFAAMNLAMPFVIINFALADLIGVGSAVPISICLGKKQQQEANTIFTCACILIFGAGVFIGGVMFAAAGTLIRWMGAEGEFADLAVQYLRVYAICSPVTTIIFAMDNFWRICGFVRGSMCLNILMSVLSVILEFLFLHVLKWGIWAAAFAVCLSMFLCVMIAFIPFLRGRALLRFCRPKFQGRMIRQIVACGSPNFLNNLAGRITSILMNAILVRMGGQAAVSLAAVFVVNMFPEQITRLFMIEAEGEVLSMSVYALRLFSLAYLTRWFSFATQSYMLSVEKPIPASMISISTALIFPVVFIGVMRPLGLTGIWLNFVGTSILAAVLSAVILRKLRSELTRPDRYIDISDDA